MNAAAAAVDCGSNSTRLLVIGSDGRVADRRLRITRLSQGVDATGRLDSGALQRTLEAIGEYHQVWQQHGVSPGRVRIAATSAVRDADNRETFYDGVRELTGVEPEVLSGAEEAELSFLGATGALEVRGSVAVMDIGGGSTELVVGAAGEVHGAHSMQLGSVRLTERHLCDDPATDDQIGAARAMIEEQLERTDRAFDELGANVRDSTTLVGVAGTVTTVAALALELGQYDPDQVHGAELSGEVIGEWTARLLGMSTAQRAALEMVQAGREDVIHAGALILHEVMRRYGKDRIVVSEADILDGLARSVQ